jgi:hypothetical protein
LSPGAVWWSGRRKARKQFFFAKKNQKTFDNKALAVPQHAPPIAKVFASFFKKKAFA